MGTSPDLEIVMWMNQPSPHQDHLSAELIRQGAKLTVIYASRLRADRQQIGWEVDDLSPWTSVLPGRFSFFEALRILRRHRKAIHIVNGIWAEPVFFVVVMFCLLQRIRYCIYSEAPASMATISLTASLKRQVQRQIVRTLGRNADGLLAISWLAEEAYAALGFPKRKIYRFGYFENVPHVETTCRPQSLRRREVMYVGRLVKGKGIEFLIEAITPLLREDASLRLVLVGAGELENELRNQIDATGLKDQIVFRGVVRSRSVHSFLKQGFMLVLPSEMDGWGIVVNQALQAGTPVVVSDSCGSAELVANEGNGYIFRTGDINNLQECMRAVIDNSDSRSMRDAAQEAGYAASAKIAAPYLLNCLQHMTGRCASRPIPPWIRNQNPGPKHFSTAGSVEAVQLSC